MSPLAELLIIVAIALVVLFAIIFIFRADKESKNESFKPEQTPEEPEIKDWLSNVKEVPVKEDIKEPVNKVPPTERVNVHFSTLPKPSQDGKGPSYEILPKVFEDRNGELYQVIRSSSGAIFYIKNEQTGTRRYLRKEEIETLKDL